MKSILIFALSSSIALFASQSHSQSVDCPLNSYALNNQADVDNFPSCDNVRRNLVIEGAGISNLDGLSQLTTIGRNLIIRHNPALTDTTGLSGITSIGVNFSHIDNDLLTNIDFLAALTSIGKNIVIRGNAILTNINGLAGISIAPGSLQIRINASLKNLNGLAALTSTGNFFHIDNNPQLTSVAGLAALTQVDGTFRIRNNDALTNLDGLSALTSVTRNIIVDQNAVLDACTAIIPLIDDFDDDLPGPGPFVGSVPGSFKIAPDVGRYVRISNNLTPTCNTPAEILGSVEVPLFTQMFSPETINLSGSFSTSTATFTIDNSASAVRATELDFSNTLPAELLIAVAPNATTTCTDGALTAVAGTSTISYTNGTVPANTTCTVTVDLVASALGSFTNTTGDFTFTLGNSGTSSATLTVEDIPVRTFTGALPSGGSGTLSFTTSDPRCTFMSVPVFTSADSISPPPPSSIDLVDGVVQFAINNCTPGATVELTLEYGEVLPAGSSYWKAADPWRKIPSTVSDKTVTFSITDGGENDDDGTENGEIVDPGGVGYAPPESVPVNQPLMLLFLSLALVRLASKSRRT